MWRNEVAGNNLPGQTAADSVHSVEIIRRAPVPTLRSAPVPVRRRRVVYRHAFSNVETAPDVELRFRQPGLGAFHKPSQHFFKLLLLVVNACHRMHSVRVPLPRRLPQKRRALLRPGLALATLQNNQLVVR
jgi:hypothetical protein